MSSHSHNPETEPLSPVGVDLSSIAEPYPLRLANNVPIKRSSGAVGFQAEVQDGEASRQLDEERTNGRSSSTLTIAPKQTSSPFAEQDSLLECTSTSESSSSLSHEVLFQSTVIMVLFLGPLLILVGWIAIAATSKVKIFSLESAKIGGKLSQPQAKFIDFLCSVVLAPVLVAGLDYFWFQAMRVVALNEMTLATKISLRALTTASGADTGSYNILKTWTFFRTQRGALQAFALLLLFSAMTKSFLANITAYETFEIGVSTHVLELQPLPPPMTDDDAISENSFLNPQFTPYADAYVSMDGEQKTRFNAEYASALTKLGHVEFVNGLVDGTYIGLNVTSRSLRSVPQRVQNLTNVPAYRMSMECIAEAPASPGLSMRQNPTNEDFTDCIVELSDGLNTSLIEYIALFSGAKDTLFDVEFEKLYARPMVMFDNFAVVPPLMYMAFLTNLDERVNFSGEHDTSPWTSSPFGKIEYIQSEDIEKWGDAPPSGSFSTWGVRCSMSFQDGLVDLKRTNDTWAPVSSTWSKETTRHPYFALRDLGMYMSIDSTIASRQDLGLVVARHKPCPPNTLRCSRDQNEDLDQHMAPIDWKQRLETYCGLLERPSVSSLMSLSQWMVTVPISPRIAWKDSGFNRCTA